MTSFLIVITLSVMSGILFTVFSLSVNANTQRGRKESAFPFLFIALGSLLLFTLQQGCGIEKLFSMQILYGVLDTALHYNIADTYPFLAAALLLLLIAYYLKGHLQNQLNLLQRSLLKLQFCTSLLTVFVSLSAASYIGFFPSLSFLFFPGWISSGSFSGKWLVFRATIIGALSYLIGILLTLLVPVLPVGFLLAVSLVSVCAAVTIMFRRKPTFIL